MGTMKEFGILMASMVYKENLKDDRIVEIIQSSFNSGIPEKWIRLQINHIRKNPKIYKERIR